MRIFCVAMAMLIVGCAEQVEPRPSPTVTPQPSLGEQVPLLTQRPVAQTPPVGAVTGCYTNWWAGVLTVDKTYGTAMADEGMAAATGHSQPPGPIMWPTGYTGYRVGSQVAVVDTNGNVVAITGQRYKIIMGGLTDLDPIEPHVPGALLACGPPLLEPVSPTANPSDYATN